MIWRLRLTVLAVLAAISGGATAACVTAGDWRQICGLQSPKDMEVLPGGRHILISEMAGEKRQPGRFAVLEVGTEALKDIQIEAAAVIDWGDPACRQRSTEALSPHGIHLSQGADGQVLMLAINHGDQESVQAYDVRAAERNAP